MPKYKVLEPGFYKGKLYDPNGKRRIVSTDRPLKPVPKWLEAMTEPTPAAKKPAAKKPAAKKPAAKKEEPSVDFTESSSNVETL